MAQSAEMLTKFMKRSAVRRSTTPPVRKRRKPGTVNVAYADDPSATYKVGTDPLYTKPGEAKRYARPPSYLGSQGLPSSPFKPRKGGSGSTSLQRARAETPGHGYPGFIPGLGDVPRARIRQIKAAHDTVTNKLKQRPSSRSMERAPYRGKRKSPRPQRYYKGRYTGYATGRNPTVN